MSHDGILLHSAVVLQADKEMRRKDEELEYDGEEDEMAELLGDETAVPSEPGMFVLCM